VAHIYSTNEDLVLKVGISFSLVAGCSYGLLSVISSDIDIRSSVAGGACGMNSLEIFASILIDKNASLFYNDYR
jgi:hypothetical protein